MPTSKYLVFVALLAWQWPMLASANSIAHQYRFGFTVSGGSLDGTHQTGTYSFDASQLTNSGDESTDLLSFEFPFNGYTFLLGDTTTAKADFTDGVLRGISLEAASAIPDQSISFVSGLFDLNEQTFTYSFAGVPQGGAGYPDNTILTTPIPEPPTLWFAPWFLGLLACRRRKPRHEPAPGLTQRAGLVALGLLGAVNAHASAVVLDDYGSNRLPNAYNFRVLSDSPANQPMVSGGTLKTNVQTGTAAFIWNRGERLDSVGDNVSVQIRFSYPAYAGPWGKPTLTAGLGLFSSVSGANPWPGGDFTVESNLAGSILTFAGTATVSGTPTGWLTERLEVTRVGAADMDVTATLSGPGIAPVQVTRTFNENALFFGVASYNTYEAGLEYDNLIFENYPAQGDSNSNGIPDGLEITLKSLYGMGSGEVYRVPNVQAFMAAAWVSADDLKNAPFCLFGVVNSSSFSSVCLKLNADGGLNVKRDGSTVYDQASASLSDGLVFVSLGKDGGNISIGINSQTVSSTTFSVSPEMLLVGADLDQNLVAKTNLSLPGLFASYANVIPASASRGQVLTAQQLAAIAAEQQPQPPNPDNCPNRYNPDQADADSNGIGDACDPNTIRGIFFGSAAVQGTASGDTIVGDVTNNRIDAAAGNDWVVSGGNRQTVTLGAGDDTLEFVNIESRGDIVTDFTPGEDKFKLVKLLASVNYQGSDPIADGYVGFRSVTGGCYLMFDLDGAAGKATAVYLAFTQSVQCNALNNPANFIFADG